MHTTSIRLPDELKQSLDEVAQFHDRKPHWLMVKAIETYIESEKAQLQYYRDRIDALEADIADNTTIEGARVTAWLEKIANHETADSPNKKT